MTGAEELGEIWRTLGQLPSRPGDVQVWEETGIRSAAGEVRLAVDAAGRRHVLIPVGRDEPLVEDRRSSGIQVLGSSLILERTQRFIDVACQKPHLNSVFSVIAAEMLDSLSGEQSRPDLVCAAVLERWRELLERAPSDAPSLETLLGLFGEMWHLREVIRRNPSAVTSWTGPAGARHDFRCPELALEVKATLTRHGRFFEIHGHEQLESPEDGQLYLAALKLEQDVGGESVVDLFDAMVTAGADRQILLTHMNDAGLGPQHLEQCRAVRFAVRESRIYRVDESFPHITSGSFTAGQLPSGVLRLTYQIDLTAEPPIPLGEEEVGEVYAALAGCLS